MRLVTIGSRGRRHYRITEAGRAALAQGEFHIPEGVSRT
jgi:DNA-binding PadR family transcriptional regulator